MQATKFKQGALALLAASLFFTAPSAFAKVIWQDFSVSFLSGSNYDPQPKSAMSSLSNTPAATPGAALSCSSTV